MLETRHQLLLCDNAFVELHRGKAKVDGQWKLYCMMHNIEKLARQGNDDTERNCSHTARLSCLCSDYAMRNISAFKVRQKMKVEIPFEENLAEVEQGVQNWVFIQRR